MLPLQYIYIYIYIRKTELVENGSFRFFAANGKWRTSVYFPWSANENGKQGLLCQQTCIYVYYYIIDSLGPCY